LLSLVLNFIGAIGLGFDLLRGYPKRNRRAMVEVRLTNLREFIATIEQRTLRLPAPPYTDAEKQQLLADFHNEWDPQRARLEAEIKTLSEGHELWAFLLGWFGVFMLAGGFLLDAVSTLIGA